MDLVFPRCKEGKERGLKPLKKRFEISLQIIVGGAKRRPPLCVSVPPNEHLLSPKAFAFPFSLSYPFFLHQLRTVAASSPQSLAVTRIDDWS